MHRFAQLLEAAECAVLFHIPSVILEGKKLFCSSGLNMFCRILLGSGMENRAKSHMQKSLKYLLQFVGARKATAEACYTNILCVQFSLGCVCLAGLCLTVFTSGE